MAVDAGCGDVADALADLHLEGVAPAAEIGMGDQFDVARLFRPRLVENEVDAFILLAAGAADRICLVIWSRHWNVPLWLGFMGRA